MENQDILIKIQKLKKAIQSDSDPDVIKVFEKKLGKLNCELYKSRYPYVFMNPAILQSEEDRIIGCLKLDKEEITFAEYIKSVKSRISYLCGSYINTKLESKIDKIQSYDGIELEEEEIAKELEIIIQEKVDSLYDTLKFTNESKISTADELVHALLNTEEFQNWSFYIRQIFYEASSYKNTAISIYGEDPFYIDAYDDEAYINCDEISFEDIIEALRNNEESV